VLRHIHWGDNEGAPASGHPMEGSGTGTRTSDPASLTRPFIDRFPHNRAVLRYTHTPYQRNN